MARISQNGIKSGFFVMSGRNSTEIEGDFHYYLKKQSQFRRAKENVTSFRARDYGRKHAFGGRKNKANLFCIEYCVMRIGSLFCHSRETCARESG
jgi:hypothetical protein